MFNLFVCATKIDQFALTSRLFQTLAWPALEQGSLSRKNCLGKLCRVYGASKSQLWLCMRRFAATFSYSSVPGPFFLVYFGFSSAALGWWTLPGYDERGVFGRCHTLFNVLFVGNCRYSKSPVGKVLLLENNLEDHQTIHSWVKFRTLNCDANSKEWFRNLNRNFSW